MKKYFLNLLIAFSIGILSTQAQIVSGELPPSFNAISFPKLIEHKIQTSTISIEKPDIKALQAEDKIADQQKNIPWRFGFVYEVNYTLNNSGEWFHYENGESIYKIDIEADSALSINLNFSKFYLSNNAKLFVYNNQKTDILGAITKNNNKVDSIFSIRPIKGSKISLELYVPSNEIAKNIIQIESIVYGYRDIYEKSTQTFGNSESCEVNINCPEGDKWDDIKRSVVMILNASNSRQCTGTLLNNTAEDSIPYVITAEHCGMGNGSIFIFNYESPHCNPSVDPGTTQSISHSFFRASFNETDFLLLELSQKPPASYGAYYSGWDIRDTVFLNGTGIHHPKRDVKKISYTGDVLVSDAYNDDFFSNSHWRTQYWHYGATESGSSGSALFNEDQHFVGQLQGGGSFCGNNFPDYYGKAAVSWKKSTSNNRQLAHWLDPINSNQKTLRGMDTKIPTYTNDLKLIGIHGIGSYYCDSTINFLINFKNTGSNNINNADFIIRINQKDSLISWNGLLKSHEVGRIELNGIAIEHGVNNISAFVQSINGTSDDNISNDTAYHQVFANHQPIIVDVEIKTDNYGSETAWNIKSSTGQIVAEGGYYHDNNGGNIFKHTACLYDSCFTFNLIDLAGDGFNGYYGNGYALVTLNGDTLIYENSFSNQFTKSINFCITSSLPKNILINNSLVLYPNPIRRGDILTIKDENLAVEAILYDLNGREVQRNALTNQKKHQIPLSENLKAGIYFIEIKSYYNQSKYKKVMIVD